jgi:hypothetical protein
MAARGMPRGLAIFDDEAPLSRLDSELTALQVVNCLRIDSHQLD